MESTKAESAPNNSPREKNYVGAVSLAILIGGVISFFVIPDFFQAGSLSMSGHSAFCGFTLTQGFPVPFYYYDFTLVAAYSCATAGHWSILGMVADQTFWTGLIFLALFRMWR